MNLPQETFKQCVQIGVVVKNVDRSVEALTRIFGMGPFRVMDWPPAGRSDIEKYYHGKPAQFTARMAFTELGGVELELIQPIQGPSIWADFLEQHGEGIHHIRFNTLDEKPVLDYLAQEDIVPIQSGSGIRPGTFWYNLGTEEQVGFTIEFMRALAGTSGRTPQIVDGKAVT